MNYRWDKPHNSDLAALHDRHRPIGENVDRLLWVMRIAAVGTLFGIAMGWI